jgi:hypothetical protein
LRTLDKALEFGYIGIEFRGGNVNVKTSMFPKTENTGIGMSLCQELLAEIQGDYDVNILGNDGRYLAFSSGGECPRSSV